MDNSNRFRPGGADVGSIIFQLEASIQFLEAAVIFRVPCTVEARYVTLSWKPTVCFYADYVTSEFIIFYESRIGHSVSAHILGVNIKVTSICREFCLRIQDSQPVSNDDVTLLTLEHFFFRRVRKIAKSDS